MFERYEENSTQVLLHSLLLRDMVPTFSGKKGRKGAQQPSEIEFSINIDEDFLTIRSTMLFYKFPNKTTTYLKLNQTMLLIRKRNNPGFNNRVKLTELFRFFISMCVV